MWGLGRTDQRLFKPSSWWTSCTLSRCFLVIFDTVLTISFGGEKSIRSIWSASLPKCSHVVGEFFIMQHNNFWDSHLKHILAKFMELTWIKDIKAYLQLKIWTGALRFWWATASVPSPPCWAPQRHPPTAWVWCCWTRRGALKNGSLGNCPPESRRAIWWPKPKSKQKDPSNGLCSSSAKPWPPGPSTAPSWGSNPFCSGSMSMRSRCSKSSHDFALELCSFTWELADVGHFQFLDFIPNLDEAISISSIIFFCPPIFFPQQKLVAPGQVDEDLVTSIRMPAEHPQALEAFAEVIQAGRRTQAPQSLERCHVLFKKKSREKIGGFISNHIQIFYLVISIDIFQLLIYSSTIVSCCFSGVLEYCPLRRPPQKQREVSVFEALDALPSSMPLLLIWGMQDPWPSPLVWPWIFERPGWNKNSISGCVWCHV